VVEIIPTRCSHGFLERCRPLWVGLSESPNLIGCQVQLPHDRSERLARIDRIQESLTQLRRESLLRSCSPEPSLCVVCACRHGVQRQPLCQPVDLPWRALVTARR
jgi:hypothetical protein